MVDFDRDMLPFPASSLESGAYNPEQLLLDMVALKRDELGIVVSGDNLVKWRQLEAQRKGHHG